MPDADGPMLAHHVFFSLVDNSEAARRKLVEACKRHLTDHPGTVYFAVGTLAEEIDWSVSDRQFDVALSIVFRNKAAHDQYQDSPRHEQFLEENQANWSRIRSFDAYVR